VNSVELLEKLVSFPTVSDQSNLDLVLFVKEFLAARGISAMLVPDATGAKASLFATVGPNTPNGIVLSAHTDVVPANGQNWRSDPFTLAEQGGHLYGRGTADMKGFVACALAAADRAAQRALNRPLHLAFSYDEEIGCVGVRPLLQALACMPPLEPALCIVGEPTGMRVALGHKGKMAARAICHGTEAHSAVAPHALNAIHLATDFIAYLRIRQTELEQYGARDAAYDVPYTTIHVGKIAGGLVLNIVPNTCVVDFEIRNVPVENAKNLLREIRVGAGAIVEPLRSRFEHAEIHIEVVNSYPGLDTMPNGAISKFIKTVGGDEKPIKVSFGTEGGLYHQELGFPTVVCGPGFMEQGHKPDEYISREQMDRCDALLQAVINELAS
jgi:acetylornithine deacetylase